MWFRFQNGFFTDQNILCLSESAQLTFLFLCCEASKANVESFTTRIEYVSYLRKKSPEQITSDIYELQTFNLVCVEPAVICPAEAVTRPATITQDNESTATVVLTTDRQTDNTEQTRQDNAMGSANPIAARRVKPTAEKETAIAKTWHAYKQAYADRHGEPPPWNSKIAGQLKQFVSRIPASEAPDVAAFYVHHNSSRYVGAMHPAGMMLIDAEKLRTEWATGKQMTAHEAKASDRKQTNINVWQDLKAEFGK